MTGTRNPASSGGIGKMSAKTAQTAIIIGYKIVPKTGAHDVGQELAPNWIVRSYVQARTTLDFLTLSS